MVEGGGAAVNNSAGLSIIVPGSEGDVRDIESRSHMAEVQPPQEEPVEETLEGVVCHRSP